MASPSWRSYSRCMAASGARTAGARSAAELVEWARAQLAHAA